MANESRDTAPCFAEIFTGIRGAGSYRDFAEQWGFEYIEPLDFTSSAGNWTFLVSRDGGHWQVLTQANNYPRPGFTHTLDETEHEGTAEEVAELLSR